jgi:hypothetical protein
MLVSAVGIWTGTWRPARFRWLVAVLVIGFEILLMADHCGVVRSWGVVRQDVGGASRMLVIGLASGGARIVR